MINSKINHDDNFSNLLFNQLPEEAKLNIFKYLTPTDWGYCQEVDKNWKAKTKNLHPLIAVIKLGSPLSEVISLLNQGASPKMQIEGSKFSPIVDYTPYLCAKDYQREDIANVL